MRKWCWLAKETSEGWKIGVAVGNKPVKYIQKLKCKTTKDVRQLLEGSIVFVHLRKKY